MLKLELDEKYGAPWQVIIGKKFGARVTYVPSKLYPAEGKLLLKRYRTKLRVTELRKSSNPATSHPFEKLTSQKLTVAFVTKIKKIFFRGLRKLAMHG